MIVIQRWAWSLVAALLTIVGLSRSAYAFKPPTLDGHVVDTANALTHEQILALDHKLEDVRVQHGFEIVAFVVGSLEGEPKEDVAYTCFNAWKLGKKGADNGVLLLIAPNEHKTFLATGKGVEGELTDLQSDDILNQQVIPALKENHIYEAVDHGTSAIARTLTGSAPTTGPHRAAPHAAPSRPLTLQDVLIGAGALVVFILLLIFSSTFRSIIGFLFQMFLFSGGRGGGGSGGDSGSGYSGGGGSTGGGGAGEDY